MNLYIINHTFHYELENVTRLFFPDEKINILRVCEEKKKPYIYTEFSDRLVTEVCVSDFCDKQTAEITSDPKKDELSFAQMLYKLLCSFTGITQPWGLITGVRPIKLLRNVSEEIGVEQARKTFTDEYFVSKEKLELAAMTEENERKILELSRPESFSLYVGIPFCPSRCSYCSFVMSSIERAKKLVEPYTELLCEEIKRTAEIASKLNLRLETVYFGGGTPTTLNPEQLSKVIGMVNSCFDTSTCREFTVEAGRPDTIDLDKLAVLRDNKVDRISINPQTLNEAVLQKIGRKHTVEQFFEAYELARKSGFKNINTDLIAGLPTDTFDSFKETIDKILELDPECITVHTLCMKRSSTLTEMGVTIDKKTAIETRKMLEYNQDILLSKNYIPYYLYRQSRMAGNLENVGWSKKGYESLYNVYVMDETHTILACGAGAVTKLKKQNPDYLERIFNYKYPYEYIDRFDEMLKRKEAILSFYGK